MASEVNLATGNLMQGKRGLIMGVANDHSIAWGIAQALFNQGAKLAFTYQGEALGKRVKPLAGSVNSDFMLECDVENIASVDSVFAEIGKQRGGLDFLVHAIVLLLHRSRQARRRDHAGRRQHADADL
jgi:enoyl-[acyl-carrier protein] reductase I